MRRGTSEPQSQDHSRRKNPAHPRGTVMQLTASQFAAVDTAYRQERITTSFRDHAASHDLLSLPRRLFDATTEARIHAIRTA